MYRAFSDIHLRQHGYNLRRFGAGHVSIEVAAIAKRVHFRVVVLDDREKFANPERFVDADGIVVLQNFENAFVNLSTGL